MPSAQETQIKGEIHSREQVEQVLKATLAVYAKELHRAQVKSERQKPYHDDMLRMFESIQQNPELLQAHPLAIDHDSQMTHVIVPVPTRYFLCKPLKVKLFNYLKREYPRENTVFKAFRAHDSTPEELAQQARNAYLEGVKSVRLVHIEPNLKIEDAKLLPISAAPTQKHVHTTDGSSEDLVDTVLSKYLLSTIYNALLRTQIAEYFSRTVRAQSSINNIDRLLPQLIIELNAERQQTINTAQQDLYAHFDSVDM